MNSGQSAVAVNGSPSARALARTTSRTRGWQGRWRTGSYRRPGAVDGGGKRRGLRSWGQGPVGSVVLSALARSVASINALSRARAR